VNAYKSALPILKSEPGLGSTRGAVLLIIESQDSGTPDPAQPNLICKAKHHDVAVAGLPASVRLR